MRCGFYMGRSARPMRRPMCLDGPSRTAAHEMRCTTTTPTTSTVPMRPPTCLTGRLGPWPVTRGVLLLLLRVFWVCPGRYPSKTDTFVRCIPGKSPRVYHSIWCLVQMSYQSLGTVVGVRTTPPSVSLRSTSASLPPNSPTLALAASDADSLRASTPARSPAKNGSEGVTNPAKPVTAAPDPPPVEDAVPTSACGPPP